MGRTQRKRRKRHQKIFTKINDEPAIKSLMHWLVENGFKNNSKFSLANFQDCGRGILAEKSILPGEVLVELPLNLTINVSTIIQDKCFCEIFANNSLDFNVRYTQTLSFQALLAFYLLYLKTLSNLSYWSVYIKSLPSRYDVSYYIDPQLHCHLEANVRSIIQKQRADIYDAYTLLNEIISQSKVRSLEFESLRHSFTKEEYEWAYFTVNTRCVYVDLNEVFNFNNIDCALMHLIKEKATISLCPYLDMINHSPKVNNISKLDIKEKGTITDLKEFNDLKFYIYTKDKIKKYSQVYICYGESNNLKLITEYGFFMPNNQSDYVNIDFTDLYHYFRGQGYNLSQKQSNFVKNHGLDKDLHIDSKGLSFNLYALLIVIKLYHKEISGISHIIYNSNDGIENNSLVNVIEPFVNEKICNYKSSLVKLHEYDLSVPLLNYIRLLEHYIELLENVIK